MNKLIFFLLFFFLTHSNLFSAYQRKQTISSVLWGEKPSESHLHLGMWTYHFDDEEREIHNWRNRVIGLEHKGIFFVTLINSHQKRIHSIGISRSWYNKKLHKDISTGFGFRLGGIYGYDRDLGQIAVDYKILPFTQIYTYLTFKRLRMELSSIHGQIASLTFGIVLKKY